MQEATVRDRTFIAMRRTRLPASSSNQPWPSCPLHVWPRSDDSSEMSFSTKRLQRKGESKRGPKHKKNWNILREFKRQLGLSAGIGCLSISTYFHCACGICNATETIMESLQPSNLKSLQASSASSSSSSCFFIYMAPKKATQTSANAAGILPHRQSLPCEPSTSA